MTQLEVFLEPIDKKFRDKFPRTAHPVSRPSSHRTVPGSQIYIRAHVQLATCH